MTGNFIALFVAPQIAERFGWPFAFLTMATLAGMFLVLWIFYAQSVPPTAMLQPTGTAAPGTVRVDENGNGDGAAIALGQSAPSSASSRTSTLANADHDDANVGQVGVVHRDDDQGSVDDHDGSTNEASIRTVLYHFFTTIPVIAVMLQHMVFNGAKYFLSDWMPTYYDSVFKIPPHDASYYLLTAEFVGVVAQLSVGKLEHAVRTKHDLSILASRRLFSAAGFGWIALVFVLMAMFPSPGLQCVWLSMATMSNAAHSAGFKSNYLDLTQTHQGLLMGAGNTVATLITFIFPITVAYMLNDAESAGGDGAVDDPSSLSSAVIAGGVDGAADADAAASMHEPQTTADSSAWSAIFVAIACMCTVGAVISMTLTSTDSIDKHIKS